MVAGRRWGDFRADSSILSWAVGASLLPVDELPEDALDAELVFVLVGGVFRICVGVKEGVLRCVLLALPAAASSFEVLLPGEGEVVALNIFLRPFIVYIYYYLQRI